MGENIKMSRLKCYFAHPQKSRYSEEELMIIDELKSRRLEIYEPFRGEEELLKKYGKKHYYIGPIYGELAREIWTKDRGAILDCDMLLAYIPDEFESRGTMAELAIAYEHKKFIQVISPLKHPAFSVYAWDELYETIYDWIRRKRYVWEKFIK